MREKLLTLLFASVLILSACGGTNDTAINVEADDTEGTEQNNDAYKSYSMKNIDYDVPESWREEVSDESLKYYYPETGMLMVSFEETDGSISDDKNRDEFFGGFTSTLESFDLKEEREIKVSGMIAYEYILDNVFSDEDYETTVVLFEDNKGVITFIMTSPLNVDKDYNNEFKNIISSIEMEVQETENEADESSDSNEIVLGEPIELGDYVLTIQKYALAKDYEGKDALIINYDWENKSDESTAPFMTFRMKGFQDNIETDDAIMVDGVDLAIGQKEVRPEGKIENAQTTVGISDMDAPLELELTELFSFRDESYIAELDLSNLK